MVEVTPGRFLFALLKGAGTTEYMGSVAAASISGREGRVLYAALSAEVQGKRGRAAGVIQVPEGQYPMLVTFGNIADPASVRLVDPGDLAASFGPGGRLKSVTLEVTDESVTEGVLECVRLNDCCVPPDLDVPYSHPLWNVPNNLFSRRASL